MRNGLHSRLEKNFEKVSRNSEKYRHYGMQVLQDMSSGRPGSITLSQEEYEGTLKPVTQNLQPAHLGGGMGRVMCTLAMGNGISWTPSTARERYAVGMTAL